MAMTTDGVSKAYGRANLLAGKVIEREGKENNSKSHL